MTKSEALFKAHQLLTEAHNVLRGAECETSRQKVLTALRSVAAVFGNESARDVASARERQRNGLNALMANSQELGLYDKVPK